MGLRAGSCSGLLDKNMTCVSGIAAYSVLLMYGRAPVEHVQVADAGCRAAVGVKAKLWSQQQLLLLV